MMIKKYNDASKDCQTAVRLDPGFVKVTITQPDFLFQLFFVEEKNRQWTSWN